MHTDATAAHGAGDHAHPSTTTYLKVGVVLFTLTALEVLAYEVGHRPTWPLHGIIEPLVVPILLILSAFKFALVAMFYMHLKQDSKLFTNLFVWPILLAGVVILALIGLKILWLKASY